MDLNKQNGAGHGSIFTESGVSRTVRNVGKRAAVEMWRPTFRRKYSEYGDEGLPYT